MTKFGTPVTRDGAGERVEEGRVRAGGRAVGVAQVGPALPLPVARTLDLSSRSKVRLVVGSSSSSPPFSAPSRVLRGLLLLLVGALGRAGVTGVGVPPEPPESPPSPPPSGSVTSGTVGISMSSSGVPGGTSTCTGTSSPLSSRTWTVCSSAVAGRLARRHRCDRNQRGNEQRVKEPDLHARSHCPPSGPSSGPLPARKLPDAPTIAGTLSSEINLRNGEPLLAIRGGSFGLPITPPEGNKRHTDSQLADPRSPWPSAMATLDPRSRSGFANGMIGYRPRRG